MAIRAFIELLEKKMAPALGCTDPAGIAFAASCARSFLTGKVLSIYGEFSTNIIKNAAAVCIPRTGGKCGVTLALALGALGGESEKGLQGLSGIDGETLRLAEAMIQRGDVSLAVSENPKKLYMKVTVTTAEGEATVVVEDDYLNVMEVIVNGVFLQGSKRASFSDSCVDTFSPPASHIGISESANPVLSIETILSFAREVPIEELKIIEQAIDMNVEIAEEGLANEYGMSLGRKIREYVADGKMGEGLAASGMMWVAAATDARMAGCDLPVMSNTGSGNQGLASTVPVISIARKLGSPREEMVRAVTISSLVTIYIKEKFGVMSAVCGAAIAGAGTSCGVVYLLGGGNSAMVTALKSVLGDLAGILCDGAKAGCAMKAATCTSAGVLAALMAMDNTGIPETDGIVGRDEHQTIDNFIRIATQGMNGMDNVILDIMMKKEASAR